MYLVYKTFQRRNLSNFFGGKFLKIDDFINTFWHSLTFSNHRLSQIVTMVGSKKVEDLEFSEGLAASNVTEEMYSRVLELYSNVILAQVRNSSQSSSDLLCARQVSKDLGQKPFLKLNEYLFFFLLLEVPKLCFRGGTVHTWYCCLCLWNSSKTGKIVLPCYDGKKNILWDMRTKVVNLGRDALGNPILQKVL